ncbi:MAG: tetraacyldisaccharide 4'-kinase [Ignavibacteriaceae bacterium]|nr:tetraacyldisaccharide 4'-kinase [Ignavibacteriaceae bacterium]
MNFLKIILSPFVPVYAFIINMRNRLFDKEIFKCQAIAVKVLSVGNLTVGGSGKTPMVIYLTTMLKKHGRKPGVLSRGYGRNTRGYLYVSDGEEIFIPVEKCGDEIYHTALDSNAPAAVSENRVSGARKFLIDADIDTIVLDDAFQHRWIKRDVDLLLIEEQFLVSEDSLNRNLLPSGLMREPFSSIKRADPVVLNRKFSEKKVIPVEFKKYLEGKTVFTAHYKAISFVDVMKHTHYELKDFEGQHSLVVSGIANPFSFLNILQQTDVNTTNKMIFRDHKDYTLKEVQQIRKQFYATNAFSVVTTQKDAVKLIKFAREFSDIDIFYLKIEIRLDEQQKFEDYILQKLK